MISVECPESPRWWSQHTPRYTAWRNDLFANHLWPSEAAWEFALVVACVDRLLAMSKENKLEAIVRDMKSHTSTALRSEVKNHAGESRREWMLQMMGQAGKENGNNNDWSRTFGSNNTISQFKY